MVITVSKPSTNVIVLGKDASDRITVSFRYDPQRVERVRTSDGRKWHKDEKCWSFPDTDKNNSTIFPEHNFEDLRRELVSRKYSYKTVKGLSLLQPQLCYTST